MDLGDAPQTLQDFPARIGRYEILLPIASGGMATVYLARSRAAGGFEREVALKLTHPQFRQDRAFSADLLEEAKLAAKIRHRNVVSVLDVGQAPHGVFLVMDYVEGDTLSHLQRMDARGTQPLPTRIALRILVDALAGLHAAHELHDEHGQPVGVVHRDFSPQNILVGTDGTAQLTDFGIAKVATRLSHTITGVVKGKIAYMSPEQARGESLDRRCDVWAAGVIAWELLARQRLHKQDNDVTTLLRIVTEPPPRLRTIAPDVPRELEDAVSRALTMDLELRCPTAEAFARELSEGAQASGGLADYDEVSACVRAVVQKKLAKRRERVARIAKLRAATEKLAQAARDQSSSSDVRSLPSKPASSAVSLDDAPTVATPVHDGAAEVASEIEARSAGKRSPVAVVVAVLAMLAVLASVTFLSSAPSPEMESVAEPSAAPVVTRAPSLSEADASASASSVAPAASMDLKQVVIVADAPLLELLVGQRKIELAPGAKATVIAITEREIEDGFELRAKSVDGRRVSKRVKDVSAPAQLVFPPRPRSKPKPAAPLATNPYPK